MPDSIADIEKNLTLQEMELVKYHRKTIASDMVGADAQGRPVTVYSTTIEVPEGPLKGKFVTVPGYFDKKTHDDEEEIFNYWKDDIEAGKWPTYDSGGEADKKAKYLHGIMDMETDLKDPAIRLYGGSS